jgi:hypothetical protein
MIIMTLTVIHYTDQTCIKMWDEQDHEIELDLTPTDRENLIKALKGTSTVEIELEEK